MKRHPLILIGAGKVGRAVVRQLLEAAPVHAQREGCEFPIVAWCDSHSAAMSEAGLTSAVLQALTTAKGQGRSFAETEHGYHQASLPSILEVAGTKGCVVVDVTATEATVPTLRSAVAAGYGVVTANKVPVAADQATFDALAGCRSFRYESTVGSAVPVIETAHALVRSNDRVDAVRGALSGTLGFLYTGLQAGQPFSLLVREAMHRGYTEPDPRIDLGGVDVARKALILARTLGWRLEMKDIAVSSLVPEAMARLSLQGFLGRMDELDEEFAGKAAQAAARGKTLRYVAEIAEGKVTVGPQTVPLASPVGRLQGNDNLVAFTTRYYPDEPLVLQGRGAGVDAAAAGVHADIVALAESRLV